jgi:hypothetical protein
MLPTPVCLFALLLLHASLAACCHVTTFHVMILQAWSSGLFLYLATSQAAAHRIGKPEAYIDPSQLGLVKASNTLVGALSPNHGPSTPSWLRILQEHGMHACTALLMQGRYCACCRHGLLPHRHPLPAQRHRPEDHILVRSHRSLPTVACA